ncbi:MAG: bifunctional riboflavin kinase/FAD synthetase [Hyphomicrobiales bacterium]|nr:bifunctional riboflavin kinase/FAD synthetase [Hyphomicrobiales bacterium]
MQLSAQTQHIARFDAMPEAWRGAVVAIGNFDGVHSGHQVVLKAAEAEAEHRGVRCIVMTFEPHPRTFFAPARPVFRLTPATLKAALIAAFGFDGTLVMTFDGDLAGMEAEDFVTGILLDRLAACHVVTGYDFHFGHNRRGTPDFLQGSGLLHGFGVTVVAEHGDEGGAVSSSRIRQALGEGDVAHANALLGWSWSVSGTVIRGDRRGRDLGYPTANMALSPDTRLRHGIYAVRFARANGEIHDGVANFGRRPTFDNGRPLLETFLFDFDGDLYGETALVSLVGWIRPEEAFASPQALIAQMDRDSAAARACLAGTPPTPLDRKLVEIWPAVLDHARGLAL